MIEHINYYKLLRIMHVLFLMYTYIYNVLKYINNKLIFMQNMYFIWYIFIYFKYTLNILHILNRILSSVKYIIYKFKIKIHSYNYLFNKNNSASNSIINIMVRKKNLI